MAARRQCKGDDHSGAGEVLSPVGQNGYGVYTPIWLIVQILVVITNYIRPLTDKTGPMNAEGKVVTLGSQIGIAEGRLTDVNGKLYAFATTTCLVFPLCAREPLPAADVIRIAALLSSAINPPFVNRASHAVCVYSSARRRPKQNDPDGPKGDESKSALLIMEWPSAGISSGKTHV